MKHRYYRQSGDVDAISQAVLTMARDKKNVARICSKPQIRAHVF